MPKIIPNSARQRVRIAKDVIKQVEAGRLIPEQGVYVRTTVGEYITVDQYSSDKVCRVCALGSILVSMVDRYNSLTPGYRHNIGTYAIPEEDNTYLLSLFPDARIIEDVFEAVASDYETKFSVWAKAYPEPRARMIAIMENIIRNKGAFVIEDVGVPANAS